MTEELECHRTPAAKALLEATAFETPTCCGATVPAHDELVVDHLLKTELVWDAQVHDMVDNIERQARGY